MPPKHPLDFVKVRHKNNSTVRSHTLSLIQPAIHLEKQVVGNIYLELQPLSL